MELQALLAAANSRGGWVDNERLQNLWTLTQQAAKLPGGFVECGVARGSSATILANAAVAQSRPLWLYDSFEGLPAPGPVDRELQPDKATADMQGRCLGTYDDVRNWLVTTYPRLDLTMIKGWFQDTLQPTELKPDAIAVLHADGDFYDSTRIILEQLGRRVVPGGFIVADDYGFWAGCRKAVDEWLERYPATLLRCGPYQAYWQITQ